jgi:hypothetical protein
MAEEIWHNKSSQLITNFAAASFITNLCGESLPHLRGGGEGRLDS